MYGNCYTAGNASGCGPASEYRNYGYSRRGYHFGGYRRPKYNVPINITDNPANYEVHVYALGFAKENMKISVVEDVLYISGTREIEEEPNFSRQEFPVRSFERTLSLNGKVDAKNISARQENGVLIVMLPKTAEAQTQEQEIKVN